MNIGASLIGQSITFGLFVWFTMRFVWPPLMKALSDREEKIAKGLEKVDQAQKILAKAHEDAKDIVSASQEEAANLVKEARRQSDEMVAQTMKEMASAKERMLSDAKEQCQQEFLRAKKVLPKMLLTWFWLQRRDWLVRLFLVK